MLEVDGSFPLYADKKAGSKTDWLVLPYPKGKPLKSPFSKLFGLEKSIPASRANLLAITNRFSLNVSKVSELFSSLLENAVFINTVEILKFPKVFWIKGL